MSRRERRFGLGDLMILIAAIGVATWGVRNLWAGIVEKEAWRSWPLTPYRLVIAAALSAVATPLTVACLAFRLRRPRPSRRRAWMQPGAAAVLGCMLVFAFRSLETVAAFAAPAIEPLTRWRVASVRYDNWGYLVYMGVVDTNGLVGFMEPIGCFGVWVSTFAAPTGYGVAAAWLVLAASGRWRPERSWVDRLGRGLGATWIAITVLTLLPARL